MGLSTRSEATPPSQCFESHATCHGFADSLAPRLQHCATQRQVLGTQATQPKFSLSLFCSWVRARVKTTRGDRAKMMSRLGFAFSSRGGTTHGWVGWLPTRWVEGSKTWKRWAACSATPNSWGTLLLLGERGEWESCPATHNSCFCPLALAAAQPLYTWAAHANSAAPLTEPAPSGWNGKMPGNAASEAPHLVGPGLLHPPRGLPDRLKKDVALV